MNKLNKLVAFLYGKKTYIMVVIGLLTVLAKHYGYITVEMEQQALWVEGFGTAAALRSALAKLIQGSQATQ